MLCTTHQCRGVGRAVTTWKTVCPFQKTNESLSNKEQNQTKIASYLQILYFLKYYSPTTVKALINSQSLFKRHFRRARLPKTGLPRLSALTRSMCISLCSKQSHLLWL